jgi:hypothetical protein
MQGRRLLFVSLYAGPRFQATPTVSQSSTDRPSDNALSEAAPRRTVPAWGLSLALHLVVMLLLAALVRPNPSPPAADPTAEGGIVLVRRSAEQTEYFDEESELADALQAAAPAATGAEAAVTPLPAPDAPPLDLAGVLPQTGPLVGMGDVASALPSVGELTAGGTGNAGNVPRGATRTQVFGLQGEGNKFLYIFDRSGSMGGYGGRPLAASKRELLASLADLGPTHQFQIIFYNQEPAVFNPGGRTPSLMWGDERSKGLAREFVQRIQAAGGTRHLPALALGLRLAPDVIFFLTDADEPQMTEEELKTVRERLNRGTVIHTVEFGEGPDPGKLNFIRRLAIENGGKSVYVDVSALR